jgi:hypothetical protein
MENNKTLEEQMLEKLIAERAEIDQQIAFLQKRVGGSISPESAPAISGGLNTNDIRGLRGAFYGLSRPQAASALLKRYGKPLTTNEIFEALRDSGFDVSGKNAFNGLYTALSRAADVRKVAPNTWGLREWYPLAKEPPKKRTPAHASNDDVLPLNEGKG